MHGVKFQLPSADPRAFVEQIPLPIPSQAGIKILARNGLIYNPSEPSRDQIRKENFNRRLRQKTEEGFLSPIWKPYQGVGDPVYVDEKHLIVDTLGLPDRDADKEEETDGRESRRSSRQSSAKQGSSMTQTKFMQRRKKKGLICLKDQLKHSEDIGRNVRIGHSFFDILDQEKIDRIENERQRRELALRKERTEMRPPKIDSSSSEDDDLTDDELKIESVLSMGDMRRRRKKQIPRPYTPTHVNINHPLPPAAVEREELRDAIFRQLCCVHWLLEGMTLDPPNTMKRISTSWNIKKMGGSKVTTKVRENLKESSQNWERFVVTPKPKVMKGTSLSTARRGMLIPMRPASRTSTTPHTKGSAQPATTMSMIEEAAAAVSEPEEDPAESEYVAFLDYDAPTQPSTSRAARPHTAGDTGMGSPKRSLIRKPELHPPERTTGGKKSEAHILANALALSTTSSRMSLPPDKIVKRMSRELITKLARFIGDELEKQSDDYIRRKAFRSTLLGKEKRLTSAPQLSDPSLFPSKQWQSMVSDNRIQFDGITEERTIDLQDKLEHMERNRIKICRQKFQAIPDKMAPHRAIQEMRSKSRYDMDYIDATSARQASFVYTPWYYDLEQNVGFHITEFYHVRSILEKIRGFAMAQSSKHTAHKLSKLLETMTNWEICNPDVSAAVWFVREKIVDMTEEEFEEWFQDAFPDIYRPPPSAYMGKKARAKSALSTVSTNLAPTSRGESRASTTVPPEEQASRPPTAVSSIGLASASFQIRPMTK